MNYMKAVSLRNMSESASVFEFTVYCCDIVQEYTTAYVPDGIGLGSLSILSTQQDHIVIERNAIVYYF